jgi:hypothetical protein
VTAASTVLEAATITDPILEGRDVRGVKLKTNEQYFAPLTIDATGRAHILSQKASTRANQNQKQS